ncbi:MAG TPA: DEAD/DEAH box helicase [Bacteroidales bacterium]|nr:DEAD/DEAH box helicase [Bacteroidales bacterium]
MKEDFPSGNLMFSLVLTRHRLWGPVLIPYIFHKETQKDYYTIKEVLFPFPSQETVVNLLPEEREVVSIINQYSEREIFKLFSRDKNVKEFIANVTEDHIRDHIRPYIEKRIFKCLEIARNESIPIFYQKSDIKSFHNEDFAEIIQENARPVFRFERGKEYSTYNLHLEIEGKPFNLRKYQTEIICNSPCVIRCDYKIIFVSEIDGAKLKPFLTKETVLISKSSEKKYFSTFVRNAVNLYRVEAKGFSIMEAEPEKEAVLNIETGLKGYPQLVLNFNYSGNSVYADEKETSFTEFNDINGEYFFRKYCRDFDWEDECIKTLGGLGFYSDDRVHFTISSLTGDYTADLYATIEAVNSCYEELTGAGFLICSKKLDKNYNLGPVKLLIDYRAAEDWFDILAHVKIGAFEIPFIKLKRNILEGRREYELPDGTVAILPEAWFARYKHVFEFGSVKNGVLKIHRQHFSIINEIFEEKGRTISPRLKKLLVPESIPSVNPPTGMKTELRKYQLEGLNWLVWLQSAKLGGCLADDMGLGKTVQTLALILFNKENKVDGREMHQRSQLTLFDTEQKGWTSLIVVPASLIYNWENEIRKFTPTLKYFTYKGNQRRKNVSYFGDYDIILTSYHIVRQDIEVFSQFHFHYVVLDESQVIKNPSSMVFRAVSMLKSDYRLVLTGTPIENSLSDLWTQLNFVNPGLLGTLAFFKREYARPVEKMRDRKKEDQLRKIIKPFILRRTKEMVAPELPPLTEQTVFCDMTEEQAEIYEKEKSAVRNSILKSMEVPGHEQNAIQVLQGLIRLRQLSNHPAMVIDEYSGGSGKFETVIRDIENILAEKHKILIFSSFVKHLMLYADYFDSQKLKYSVLTGSSTDRGSIIEKFQIDPDNRIFLISLKAGGVGLNLTSADYVFLLDPWWNPAAEIQALSRAHRIGQDKSVFVYRYISSSSIEEKIIRLQEKKSKLAETFVRSNNPLKDIDLKSLLEIIE